MGLKVLHTLGWFFPDSTGGTEVYVHELIRELRNLGVDGSVAAARNGETAESYDFEGTTVFRYPVHANPTRPQLRGSQPYGGFDLFSTWLSKQKVDVYHQHSISGGCNVHHLKRAHELGLSTVLTIHVPEALCMRGTMMLNGEEVCDGHLKVDRCTTCYGMSKGLWHSFAKLNSRVPQLLSRGLSSFPGPIGTALATKALVERRTKQIGELASLADCTVAISTWLYDALRLNGFPKDKLVLSPSGGPKVVSRKALHRGHNEEILKIGFFGRLVSTKGVDIVIKAIKAMTREVPVELWIHGVPSGEFAYEESVRRLGADDSRIRFADPVSNSTILEAMERFDLIAIPSQCLETGPLVLLEAFAAGTPVVASNLGGLAERVRDRVDGWLLPPKDVSRWTDAFQQFANDRTLVNKLRSQIREIRTMKSVADDMADIYRSLVTKAASPANTQTEVCATHQ